MTTEVIITGSGTPLLTADRAGQGVSVRSGGHVGQVLVPSERDEVVLGADASNQEVLA